MLGFLLLSPIFQCISSLYTFSEFKGRFNRIYSSPEELRFRERVYMQNCEKMKGSEHGEICELGINKFTDWTDEEFASKRLMRLYDDGNQSETEQLVKGDNTSSFKALVELASKAGKLKPGRNQSTAEPQTSFPTPRLIRQLQAQNANSNPSFPAPTISSLPRVITWLRPSSRIKDQGDCSACYVFAATGAIESLLPQPLDLSEQEIIDCASIKQPCIGGSPLQVLSYIKKNSLALTAQYPYEAKATPRCRRPPRVLQTVAEGGNNKVDLPRKVKIKGKDPSKAYRVKLPSGRTFVLPPGKSAMVTFPPQGPKGNVSPYGSKDVQGKVSPYRSKESQGPSGLLNKQGRFAGLSSFLTLDPNLLSLLLALTISPVALAHFAPPDFKFYTRGIFMGHGCSSQTPNHAATAIGYDLRGPVPFLLVKNSWGDDWGENGYYKIAIGKLDDFGKGNCLIAGTKFNVIPILDN